MALGLGVSDSLGFLGRAPDDWHYADWDIEVAIVRKAQQIDVERRSAEMKILAESIGGIVGNRVGAIVAQVLGRMG